MKSRQWYRIKKLEREFSETNIKRGEELSPETRKRINRNWQDNQQRRRVDGILNNVRNKDSIKEEVHQIVADLPNLRDLCRGCKEEVIISVIILYVSKARNPEYHVERTGLWNRYDLNWQKYSLIVSRLLQASRESKMLPYQYEDARE